MSKRKSIFKSIIIVILLLCSTKMNVYALGITQSGGQPIKIDGYFDDWDDKPYSWEYNWDNPWQIPNYWNGKANITKEYRDENGNPYNIEIRHKMSLYSDGQYVYLHIKIAENYDKYFNGYDYEFYINGNRTIFQVVTLDGKGINNNNLKIGINEVAVNNADGSLSGKLAKDSKAYIKRSEGGINDELELKIPLASMALQNPKIDIKNISTIEFFTPNLMYRHISCNGTSTGPYIGVALGVGVICLGFLKKRKKEKILQ